MRKKAIIILVLLVPFLLLFGSVQSFRQGQEFSCNNLKGANDLLAYASTSSNSLCIESTRALSNYNLNADVSLHISHFNQRYTFLSNICSKTKTKGRFDPLVASINEEMAILGIPGAAVAVIERGKVTFAAGFGTKHPDGGDPVKPTTLFRIGSLTKMLTTVSLLKLVDQGKVDLDAPITEYLPDFSFQYDSTWAPSITVRHLLTHSSGIMDYAEVGADPEFQSDDGLSLFFNNVFGTFAYLMAPAGRMYNYSNPGFMLAGLITETVSGTYYREYLEKEVFIPFGMHRTYFLVDKVLEDGDYAFGKTIHWETGLPFVVGPDSYDNPWARPAGYALTSVLDLAKFIDFLRKHKKSVVSDNLRMAMQEPQINTEEMLDLRNYGYALFVIEGGFYGPGPDDFYDIRLVGHNGAIPGYSAIMHYLPELDFAIIFLANTDNAYFNNSFIVALHTICTLPPPTEPPDLSMDPDTYDIYAGSYFDPFDVGYIFVNHVEDRLEVQIPFFDDLPIPYESELIPIAPNNFLLLIQGYPLRITFILDGEGKGEYLRTRPFVAKRQEEGLLNAIMKAQPLTFDPNRLLRMLPFYFPLDYYSLI
jgi:CubicO group peptidase (beta-lactamase class C family)